MKSTVINFYNKDASIKASVSLCPNESFARVRIQGKTPPTENKPVWVNIATYHLMPIIRVMQLVKKVVDNKYKLP